MCPYFDGAPAAPRVHRVDGLALAVVGRDNQEARGIDIRQHENHRLDSSGAVGCLDGKRIASEQFTAHFEH